MSVRYEKGCLILDDQERELLSVATMNEFDCSYPASYFICSMKQIVAECEDKIQSLRSGTTPDERASAKISILHLLIEICEGMMEEGLKAAEDANESVRLH